MLEVEAEPRWSGTRLGVRDGVLAEVLEAIVVVEVIGVVKGALGRVMGFCNHKHPCVTFNRCHKEECQSASQRYLGFLTGPPLMGPTQGPHSLGELIGLLHQATVSFRAFQKLIRS